MLPVKFAFASNIFAIVLTSPF